MTPAQVAHIMPPLPKPLTLSRGDEDGAIQLGYTAEQMQAYARAAVEAALRDAPQAEPTEAQIDAYCEAWGAAFEAEEPEAFGVTVEPLSASLRRCIVAGLRAAISAPTAVEPDERKPLTDEQIEKLRDATFNINNPFCPVDSKSMRKAVRAAERAHGIAARASKGTP